ncbi:MAG TPA: DMT family transporter, partial [Caldimonas sp.]|nr:DMT family transporter [Caldimonas sp.]
ARARGRNRRRALSGLSERASGGAAGDDRSPGRARGGSTSLAMRSSSWLIVVASLLFATMGVCIKLAAAQYSSGEIVMYRGVVGAVLIFFVSRWRGETLRTAIPARHLLRSATGVTALCLWFYAIAALPLATAMTLNYTSSLWLALFVVGGATVIGGRRADHGLVVAAVLGFAGVVFVLRPTIEQGQLWSGLTGLLSGMISALGYLQVAALGRAGETESRIVFYFSLGGVLGGAAIAAVTGWHAHTAAGVAMLVAIGVLATVAQLLLTRAYARGNTLVNASLQYLGIAFSYVYDIVLFDVRVTWLGAIGILAIVGAGVLAALVRAQHVRREAAARA